MEESNSRAKAGNDEKRTERPKHVLQLKEGTRQFEEEGQRIENAGLEMEQSDEEIEDMDEIEDEQVGILVNGEKCSVHRLISFILGKIKERKGN